jgi:SAM-dependent methyltransferase
MKNTIEIQKLEIDEGALKRSISNEYTSVVCDKDHTIHFVSGKPLANKLGYPRKIIDELPDDAVRPFAGVGNPFQIRPIKNNKKILDIGSGAGMDSLTASILTDHHASIFGLDMTPAMVEQARKNANMMGLGNVRFVEGHAEDIPFKSDTFDLVISNGVINLCVNKEKVYAEIFRILKPGGRLQIADVLLEKAVPTESRNLVHLWTNCVAGAIPGPEYLDIIRNAGFGKVSIRQSYDVFKDARVAKSAAFFGAKGHNIIGVKE